MTILNSHWLTPELVASSTKNSFKNSQSGLFSSFMQFCNYGTVVINSNKVLMCSVLDSNKTFNGSEGYSGLCQTSMMKLVFTKIINNFKSFITFTKRSLIDHWKSPKYVAGSRHPQVLYKKNASKIFEELLWKHGLLF